MVFQFKVRNPLTIEERIKIAEGISHHLSYGEMSKSIGRCKSVIRREVNRLGSHKSYDPLSAQKDFEHKQRLCGIKRNSELYLRISKEK